MRTFQFAYLILTAPQIQNTHIYTQHTRSYVCVCASKAFIVAGLGE